MRILLVFFLFIFSCSCQNYKALVSHVNAKKSSWKAESTHMSRMSRTLVKKVLGTKPEKGQLPKKPISALVSTVVLPLSFDARTKWSNCSTIKTIRDQGACGSCWAFASVSSMSDRLCIETNGAQNVAMSVENVLSCCTDCGQGCNGGYVSKSWNYWINSGIVSGGDYNSKQGCQPYTSDAFLNGITPACQTQCQNGSGLIYQNNLQKGVTAYLISNSTYDIQHEIFSYGSVCGTMKVYEDFLSYKTGVYQHLTGVFLGYHAVKMIGWGVVNSTIPYWLVANSWGINWGENGFFRLKMNTIDINIENNISAGTAR